MAALAGDETPSALKEAFADTLASALKPAVAQCDDAMNSVMKSQTALAEKVERLAAVLNTLNLEGEDAPPSFAGYAKKLGDTRKRLASIGGTLTAIEKRLETVNNRLDKQQG